MTEQPTKPERTIPVLLGVAAGVLVLGGIGSVAASGVGAMAGTGHRLLHVERRA